MKTAIAASATITRASSVIIQIPAYRDVGGALATIRIVHSSFASGGAGGATGASVGACSSRRRKGMILSLMGASWPVGPVASSLLPILPRSGNFHPTQGKVHDLSQGVETRCLAVEIPPVP